MDKNMINIDDLLKQRLTGGEEKERPGAWLAMRDLLDDQMPTRVAVGFNWRRMFTILSGAALLTAATVGGYRMYSTYSLNTPDNTVIPATVNNAAPVQGGSSSANADNSSLNNKNSDNNNNIAATPATEKAADKAQSRSEHSFKAHAASQNTAPAVKTAPATIAKKQVVPAQTIVAANPSNQQIISKYSQFVSPKTVDNINAQAAANTTAPVTAPADINTVASGNNPVAASDNNSLNTSNANATTGNSSTNTMQPASGNSVAGNNNSNKPGINKPQQPDNAGVKKLSKDSINMVAMKESYSRKNGFKVDTIDQGKVAKNTPEYADNKLVPAANSETMAMAATAKKDNKEGELLSLSQFKVSSKKVKGWESSRFEEMVKNAKFDFSKVNFYPGLVFGVAASFGQNSVGGFQIGIAGNTTLSDHWSILTELKFRQDFNMNGNVIDDNYNTNLNTKIDYQRGKVMYDWDSVAHSFTFTTLSSVHLPIAVKYSIDRLSMFFGTNLSYNFAVNYSEPGATPHKAYQELSMDNPNKEGDLRYFKSTHGGPSIKPEAFGSRFGVGALLGVAYNLTPATSVDLRYAQNVWDSKQLQNTNGASTVSDKIFNRPSLQFNISYRFSSNKYRVKTYER